MATEPSIAFEQLSGARLQAPSLTLGEDGDAYRVQLLTTATERDEVLDVDDSTDEARQRLRDVDFETELLVVIESGYGSGSVDHHWVRLEDADGVVHLHGCYTQPYIQTDDITSRSSVVVVDRPAGGLEFARISLTVGADRRVHANSTEGVVTVEE